MSLILTGLDQTWSATTDDCYLGIWCVFPSRFHLLDKIRDRILPSPWSDHMLFAEDYKYLVELTKRIIRFTGHQLNEIFSLTHDFRYWSIILGRWAWHFCFSFFVKNRYLQSSRNHVINQNISIHPRLSTKNEAQQYDIYTNDYELRHIVHYRQYSDLIHSNSQFDDLLLNYKEVEIPNRVERIGSKNTMEMIDCKDFLLCGLHIGDEGERLLCEAIGPRATVVDLYQFHDFALRLYSDGRYSTSRSALSRFTGNNSFERALGILMPIYFPYIFMEKYCDALDYLDKIFDRRPKVIVSTVGWIVSDFFGFLSADSVERYGTKLLGGQHGAIYGAYKHLRWREYEIAISDRYLCWGWVGKKMKNKMNVSSPRHSIILEKSKKNTKKRDGETKILYLGNQEIDYPRCFRQSISTMKYIDYLDWQIRFFATIPETIRRALVFRLKKPYNNDLVQYFTQHAGYVKFDDLKRPFNEVLTDTDVVVADSCTHVYSEAMVVRPTILFWDQSIWEVSGQFDEMVKKLRLQRVFHESPESAADFLCEIRDDVNIWWQHPKTQSAVQEFLYQFSRPSLNWKSEWKKACFETVGEDCMA